MVLSPLDLQVRHPSTREIKGRAPCSLFSRPPLVEGASMASMAIFRVWYKRWKSPDLSPIVGIPNWLCWRLQVEWVGQRFTELCRPTQLLELDWSIPSNLARSSRSSVFLRVTVR